MFPYSCTPQIFVVDIDDNKPTGLPIINSYSSTAKLFTGGHFACTAD